MPKPLTITSTTNALALMVYVNIAVLGAVGTFTSPSAAMAATLSPSIALTLSGLLMFGGITCLSAALVGSRRRDPTLALSMEIGALSIISVLFLIFLGSIIKYYGPDAPTLATFVGFYFMGCVFRLVQAARENRLLSRARRQRDRKTVEVTAEPDRE